MVLDDDPLYTMGQQHLLMFTSGPQGTRRVVSPAGRYGVDRSGTLTGAAQRPTNGGPSKLASNRMVAASAPT